MRRALLEADVNFKVVKDFIAAVTEKAVGKEVLSSLSPGQQVVKVVHDELVELLGSKSEALRLDGHQPVTIMLAGLQGSGKTTTAAKLANQLKKQGRKPFLVPADVYRPAAIDQLQIAQGLITTFFQGLTYTIVLVVGLSVGLGAKDLVSKVLGDWYEKIKK